MEKHIETILDKTGLNWSVRTESVQTESGIILPKKIAIIRNDNNVPIGDHKSGYVPYQNEELLELLFKIAHHTGLELHSGGLFKDGGKVFIQMKSDNLRLKNDKIEGFISGINSFDGSTALSFGTSHNTVSCQNTFWLVYKQLQTKMKHSANMKPKIDLILENIDKLIKEEQENFRIIERMADVRMSDEVKDLVIRKMFDITKEEKLDEVSTNKKNKLERFYLDLNGELTTKEDTLWGLFSGVTKYTTHTMKKTDNTEGKIFGMTGKKEREIWHKLADMVTYGADMVS